MSDKLNMSLGEMMSDLIYDQSNWSQMTFGADSVRGPIGALKHLELEAKEAQENPSDPMEYADCLLLLLDATRRAKIPFPQLLATAKEKMEINKSRKWSAPMDATTPVQHTK